jgi:hypothetical protein
MSLLVQNNNNCSNLKRAFNNNSSLISLREIIVIYLREVRFHRINNNSNIMKEDFSSWKNY